MLVLHAPDVARLEPDVLKGRRLVALFVAVQIAVPLGLLVHRYDVEGWEPVSIERYSWQMFSACGPPLC